MKTETQEFNRLLEDMVQACGRLALAVNQKHRTEDPAAAGAYADLWVAGKAKPEVRILIERPATVQIGFLTANGFSPVLTASVPVPVAPVH